MIQFALGTKMRFKIIFFSLNTLGIMSKTCSNIISWVGFKKDSFLTKKKQATAGFEVDSHMQPAPAVEVETATMTR